MLLLYYYYYLVIIVAAARRRVMLGKYIGGDGANRSRNREHMHRVQSHRLMTTADFKPHVVGVNNILIILRENMYTIVLIMRYIFCCFCFLIDVGVYTIIS